MLGDDDREITDRELDELLGASGFEDPLGIMITRELLEVRVVLPGRTITPRDSEELTVGRLLRGAGEDL